MMVYLLRHAIAVERGTASYPNDDRPLTEDGKDKMAKAAKAIAKLVDDVDVILSSPMIRAHDTASIAAQVMAAEHKLEICRELAPGSSLKNLLSYLSKYKGLSSIMIVGHEPDLGYLASALLGSNDSIIEFKKGALCAIEVSALSVKGKGILKWHLQPKQLRALA
jgi:phosphohistidine phosphatase